jgi:hypothetical protein
VNLNLCNGGGSIPCTPIFFMIKDHLFEVSGTIPMRNISMPLLHYNNLEGMALIKYL